MREELTPKYVDYIPSDLEEGVIYISKKYETSVHLCPCGCGSQVVLPFNKKYGWRFTDDNGKVSFYPSVGNFALHCKSHYFIKDNRIEWV